MDEAKTVKWTRDTERGGVTARAPERDRWWADHWLVIGAALVFGILAGVVFLLAACANPLLTPQNAASAFTACGGGVTSPDGGVLYCETDDYECPIEGHACIWVSPQPCEMGPCAQGKKRHAIPRIDAGDASAASILDAGSR